MLLNNVRTRAGTGQRTTSRTQRTHDEGNKDNKDNKDNADAETPYVHRHEQATSSTMSTLQQWI